MLTPNGQPANKIEKVMLLALWAHNLKEEIELASPLEAKPLISAGMGKPTYPINQNTVQSYLSYWQNLDNLTKKWHLMPEQLIDNSAIDYGDPRGDKEPRALMANVMSSWYSSEIKPENVLFTIGGIGALRVIFETFNTHYEDTPGYRVITPFPHYSAYSNNPLHKLHPIDVMKEPGYRLTASALENSIKEAYLLAEIDNGFPKAILICNPSNPLGTIIDEAELNKIAKVLRAYPELYIIFDEAYSEMCFTEMPSFLKIAPDLKLRVIILRSATKALSAAGERMAVLLVFDEALMNELLNKNISYFIHAPRSAQIAYAQTMAKLDEAEKSKLVQFYKKKVDYVIERLRLMGASMPDPSYQVEATFYALANFNDLLGLELPQEAYRVLQKTGTVTTGEELAYYLLFEDRLMITPLSYFGLPKDSGFMRITCSGNNEELQELMDRLETRLFQARKKKEKKLMEQLSDRLSELQTIDESMHAVLLAKAALFAPEEQHCLALKNKNQSLTKLLSIIISFMDIAASNLENNRF